MGQNQVKTGLRIRSQAQSVVDSISTRFHSVNEFKSLSYDQFIHEVQLLNQILDELTKSSDKTIQFSTATPGSANKLFWKATTRIVCDKVLRETGVVLSTKQLSVRRFVRLYGDVMIQMSAVSAASATDYSQSDELCASYIMDGLDGASLPSITMPEECCICMERDCELILTCTHGFCEECIEKWSRHTNTPRPINQNSTCPICRESLETPKNHWVMATPDTPALTAMPEVILGLVDRAKGEKVNVNTSRPQSVPAMSSETASPCLTPCLGRTLSLPAASAAVREEPIDYTSIETSEGFTLISHSRIPEDNSTQ